jgi:hypothetical protein
LEALAAQWEEYDALMERVQKERKKFMDWEREHAAPRHGWKLAREAVDLNRYSPLANVTDPAAPRYSADHVVSEARRIEQELKH